MGLDLVVDDPQREVVAVVPTERLDVVGDHPEGVAGGPVALRQLRQRVSAGVRAPGDLPERRIAAEIVKSGVHVSPDTETDVALLSFSTPILERMAAILPDAPRGHLFYREPEEVMFAAAAQVKASFIMPEKGHLSPGLLERAKQRGLDVATWVCDDAAEFKELSRLGLLGIGTNRPVEMIG